MAATNFLPAPAPRLGGWGRSLAGGHACVAPLLAVPQLRRLPRAVGARSR